jgi:hypothetical protein
MIAPTNSSAAPIEHIAANLHGVGSHFDCALRAAAVPSGSFPLIEYCAANPPARQTEK